MERLVDLTTDISNDTPVDTAVSFYRGPALVESEMPAGAIDILTLANRQQKDRPSEVVRQIRYDRALLYEQVGRKADARREMERLYAEAPGFADLRNRLN